MTGTSTTQSLQTRQSCFQDRPARLLWRWTAKSRVYPSPLWQGSPVSPTVSELTLSDPFPSERYLFSVLPEMPLPIPIQQTLSNKSLLFHPRVAEEAQNLLGLRDERLVSHLVHSLVRTSAEHM